LATVVAGYWANRKIKSKEASSILKWRLVYHYGFGYFYLCFAMQFENQEHQIC
jgi:POT family proton-dependent oligopeptide transporter